MEGLRNKSSYIRQTVRYFKHWLKLIITTSKRRPDYPEEYDRYSYQSLYNNFDIKPDERVLDIGSGHYPFLYATVLVDLFLENSPHRCEPLVLNGRPLIVADIHNLPFDDKSFDFIYCSHVLEHVEDPIKASQEIMRVGNRGYIETPNFGKDVLFSWANTTGHKWHTVSIANTLVFFEYIESQRRGIKSTAWQEIIFAPYYHPLQEAFWKNQDVFNTMLMWKDRFKVIVFKSNGTVEMI
jgi:SAM-dependent methyltransferase